MPEWFRPWKCLLFSGGGFTRSFSEEATPNDSVGDTVLCLNFYAVASLEKGLVVHSIGEWFVIVVIESHNSG